MSFADRFPIIAQYAPLPSRRRSGLAMNPGVRFIVAHDTANPGADAMDHALFYRNDPNPVKNVSSAHLFVDDGAIVETIPALTASPEQALHVRESPRHDNELYGFNANAAAIGVEYCYGPGIAADAAYTRYTWVLAKLCHSYNLDPARSIVGHMVLDPARRHDPSSALTLSGRSYEGLLRDVVTVYRECTTDHSLIDTAVIRLGRATTTVNLRVRAAATTASASLRVLQPGTAIDVAELVKGQPVFQIDDWCRLNDGGYCWSGGIRQ